MTKIEQYEQCEAQREAARPRMVAAALTGILAGYSCPAAANYELTAQEAVLYADRTLRVMYTGPYADVPEQTCEPAGEAA